MSLILLECRRLQDPTARYNGVFYGDYEDFRLFDDKITS